MVNIENKEIQLLSQVIFNLIFIVVPMLSLNGRYIRKHTERTDDIESKIDIEIADLKMQAKESV